MNLTWTTFAFAEMQALIEQSRTPGIHVLAHRKFVPNNVDKRRDGPEAGLSRACAWERFDPAGSCRSDGSGDVVRPRRGFAGHSHGAGRMDPWQGRSRPYGVRFTDLRVFSELPSLYPEAEAQAIRRVCEPEPIPQWGVMRNGLSLALARGCHAG
jgi:hypothetical protein